MIPERWREVERIFHDAVARPAADRAAYIATACAGDHELRREVESLIAARHDGSHVLDRGAVGAYPTLMAEATSAGRVKSTGTVIGPYEIRDLIGSGGMGEVYRAVDTRLNRTVAIKLLPDEFSSDPERRARFGREAQLISKLNHPHICALYDVGIEDGNQYLVMEYLEGETLDARVKQGPLAVPRALEYLSQISDALDKAHRAGVVHRDLKPSNVMLTRSGVKLLDFGAAAPAPRADTGATGRAPSLTETGKIIGTLQYLSPEQLEGKPADARSDIFMLGAVAYEMLTGKSAFAAPSQAGIITAIMRDEPPDLSAAAPGTPPALARAVARCLAKNPDDRWQSAADLLFHLQSNIPAEGAPGRSEPAGRTAAGRAALPWAVAAAAVLWAGYATLLPRDPEATATIDPAPIRFNLAPPAGTVLHAAHSVPFSISPDGRYLALVVDRPVGRSQLWVRSLASGTDTALAGTDGANTPFWSPDGEWVGFFAAGELKKVHVATGITQVIAGNVTTHGGATWNADDVIVFPATVAGLSRVSAQGGAVTPITAGEGSLFWPQFVADGSHVIVAAGQSASIGVVPLAGGEARMLMKFPIRISSLGYVPGYVLYVQDGTLWARPFDDRRLEFSGDAAPLIDGVPVTGPGRAPFSVSAAGVLAYWTYPIAPPAVLEWIDREGRRTTALGTMAQYVGFALSPDDGRLAFSRITRGGSADVWVGELASGAERQVTFDGAAYTPRWSPDGKRIVFTSPGRNPPPKLFTIGVDDDQTLTPIGDSPTANFAAGWSPDGKSILSVRLNPATRHQLWLQRVDDTTAQRRALNTPGAESDGSISADGRWIAYVTDSSGRAEVWVARYPSGEEARQVSAGGGQSPQWMAGGRGLIYLASDRRVIAVAQVDRAASSAASLRVLLTLPDLVEIDSLMFPTANAYAAAFDGHRILAAVRAADIALPPVNVIINWRSLIGSDLAR